MIKYALVCKAGHEFEGWFQNSNAYESQAANGHLSCPICGTHEISKAIMAPRIASLSAADARRNEERQQVIAFFEKIRLEVEANAEYVGRRFADEARKIHFNEVDSRPIYGEATVEETRALREDGVPFMVLPRSAKSQN
jgi:hypothetical protein